MSLVATPTTDRNEYCGRVMWCSLLFNKISIWAIAMQRGKQETQSYNPHYVSLCLFFQGNVGPAAFWLLGYLLTNHEALTAVKAEMATLEMSTPDTPVGTPVFGETFIPTLVQTKRHLLVDCPPYCQQDELKQKSRFILFFSEHNSSCNL